MRKVLLSERKRWGFSEPFFALQIDHFTHEINNSTHLEPLGERLSPFSRKGLRKVHEFRTLLVACCKSLISKACLLMARRETVG